MAVFRIYLNGEPREISSEINIETLIEHFSLPKQLVAVELNNEVIRRQSWESTVVRADDKIEVVHFVGGG